MNQSGIWDAPFCPEGAGTVYGEPLGADVDLLPGAGHITVGNGYGAWPSALDWCLDPAARLTARPRFGKGPACSIGSMRISRGCSENSAQPIARG